MKMYKARILPEHLRGKVGLKVPLLSEHQLFGDAFGYVTVDDEHHGTIYSNSDKVFVGASLSAGSFIMGDNEHHLRELSLTDDPVYPECVVLEFLGYAEDKPELTTIEKIGLAMFGTVDYQSVIDELSPSDGLVKEFNRCVALVESEVLGND